MTKKANAPAPTQCPPPLRQHLEACGCPPEHIAEAEAQGVDWTVVGQVIALILSMFIKKQSNP